jgi:hypothetical protein
MATRPAGIRAFLRDFKTYDLDPTSWLRCSGSTGNRQIGSFKVVEPLGTGRQRDYCRGRRMRTKANIAAAAASKNEIEPATKKYLSISVILVSSRYSS